MDKINKLPPTIPIFPLSNFIIFPNTTVPLNIFEPRYIQMIDDSMKSHRMIGMIQPKKSGELKKPDLYEVGCIGKITSFNETDDGRYLVIINGISRFNINKEIETNKLYRICDVNYEKYNRDLDDKVEKFELKDLDKIFKDLKNLFEKKGFLVDWSSLKKENFSNTLNTLSICLLYTSPSPRDRTRSRMPSSA